jgi:hypothetical protein
MAYCISIEDGGVGCDGAARNAPARHGPEGLKTCTTKTTARTVDTNSGMKATSTMETTTPTMETTASMKTAPNTAGLGQVRERQPHACTGDDPRKCQQNPLAAPSSQHVVLPLY